jgi:hypothetical protein
MSSLPTPVPITFVLNDFESEFRLDTDADTYTQEVTPQTATFVLDVSLNYANFSSLFKFTTDDITLLADNQNDQRIEFITDVRKWGSLVTGFSTLPASDGVKMLSDYTTDSAVSAVQAYVSWFTFKITSIKDSAVLIKNVGEIAAEMDSRFRHTIWAQELYYKLWKHSMGINPVNDYTGAPVLDLSLNSLDEVYSSTTVNGVVSYNICDYPSSTTVVSTIPASRILPNFSTLKSSSKAQLMYKSKVDVPQERIAVMQFEDDYTNSAVEVSIAQKIFQQLMYHDPSRVRGLTPVTLRDGNDVEITDISGNPITNVYSFPFLVGDIFQMKVNVLVKTDNVNVIFDRPGVSMSQALVDLNTSFNDASTSVVADEHENYVSYLIRFILAE